MDHTPEEYGAYWAGAIRIAAGVFFVYVTEPFISGLFLARGQPPLARLFGYTIVGLVLLAGSFAVALGLGKVVKGAIQTA